MHLRARVRQVKASLHSTPSQPLTLSEHHPAFTPPIHQCMTDTVRVICSPVSPLSSLCTPRHPASGILHSMPPLPSSTCPPQHASLPLSHFQHSYSLGNNTNPSTLQPYTSRLPCPPCPLSSFPLTWQRQCRQLCPALTVGAPPQALCWVGHLG